MDFFTSDTHFGHVNVIQYCNRPFASIEAMNDGLTERWNARVGTEDTVYHLGDFALGQKVLWPEYRKRLNGRIVFIEGNHDAPTDKFTNIMQENDVVTAGLLYDWQFSKECPVGTRIWLAHVPPGGDYKGRDELVRTPAPHPERIDGVAITHHFCGHVHNKWKIDPDSDCINVGVDVWNYEPKTLEEILGAVRSLAN
jgi:calcineurin-like phosphoesterase family protein